MEAFRAALEDWLARTQTSQAELSRRSKVPQNVISRWLGTNPTRPSDGNLKKLAPVLGLPYEHLLQMCGYLPAQDQPRAEIDARRQAIRDQFDRWLTVVGPENEEYFWEHLKAQGDSTVDLIKRIGTAVNVESEAAVNAAVSQRGERARKRRGGASGPLTNRQRGTRTLLRTASHSANQRQAA